MPIFAKSYARHAPPPADPLVVTESRSAPLVTHQPSRVRVVRGVLAGLTGQVVSTADETHWLVETDQCGLLLRISPQMLEPLPPA